MYHIYFYEDRNGDSSVYNWIKELSGRKGKDAGIQLQKVNDYLTILQHKELSAGEPFVKHLAGEIWELRPLRNRILFAAWRGDGFVLLHHFFKQTRKTPQREIDRAQKALKDLREREGTE